MPVTFVAVAVTDDFGCTAGVGDGGSTAHTLELNKQKANRLLMATCMTYPFGKALLKGFTSIFA